MLDVQKSATWTHEIKNIFAVINCEDVVESNIPITSFKRFLLYSKDKLMIEHALKWRQEVFNMPKLI